jgi:hypothetical protein
MAYRREQASPFGRANRRYIDALDQIFGGLERDIYGTTQTLRGVLEQGRQRQREAEEKQFMQEQMGRLMEAMREPRLETQMVSDMPTLEMTPPLVPGTGRSPLAAPTEHSGFRPQPFDPRSEPTMRLEAAVRGGRSPEEINRQIEQVQLALLGRGTERAQALAPALQAFRRDIPTPPEERQYRSIQEVLADPKADKETVERVIQNHIAFEKAKADLQPGETQVLGTERKEDYMLIRYGKKDAEGNELTSDWKIINFPKDPATGKVSAEGGKAVAEYEKWDSKVHVMEEQYGKERLQEMVSHLSGLPTSSDEYRNWTQKQRADFSERIVGVPTQRQIVKEYLDALASRDAARRAIETGGGVIEGGFDDVQWPGALEQPFPGQVRPPSLFKVREIPRTGGTR